MMKNGWSQIKSWYDSNPGARQKPLMQFPVVIFFDEETITYMTEMIFVVLMLSVIMIVPKIGMGMIEKKMFRISIPCFFYDAKYGSSMVVSSDDEDGWSEVKDLLQ